MAAALNSNSVSHWPRDYGEHRLTPELFRFNNLTDDDRLALHRRYGFDPLEEPHDVTDSIPVLADIAFDLRLDADARAVTDLPAGTLVLGTRTADGYHVVLPRLHYHAAVCLAGVAGAVKAT